MELPEQDRQAFIDAARRRTQPQDGGAAFGVYPSSGKRPEKLNVSRDVNMPAQMSRGWVAGTLGLPGDIEGLGRLLVNMAPAGQEHERVTGKSFVGETPVLPTSDFYREWLPGGDERPAAQFASGLGALAGGAGSTKVASAGVKGAKAAGKALGPKAAEMAEGYLQRSGLAPSVIKPKGGNWLTQDVEKQTGRLKLSDQMEPEWYEDRQRWLEEAQAKGDERAIRAITGDVETGRRNDALGNWIDKKLNRYIKNEMGTPEDPLRALAERDVLHFEPQQVFGDAPSTLMRKRMGAGMPTPLFGKSEKARRWEALADRAIDPYPASTYKYGSLDDSFLASNPWLEKVPDEAMVYKAKGLQRDMGFDHLIDELRNAVRPDSGLPDNLRYSAKELEKVTVPQAVERVAEINEWRAAQKLEADAAKARNPATFTVKEYPEQKMQWVQLKTPEMPEGWSPPEEYRIVQPPGARGTWAIMDDSTGSYIATGIKSPEQATKHLHSVKNKAALEDALKYEGDTMGHCVGGYCPDVESGAKRIYSLRDKKGEPHVTIETRPGRPWNERSGIFYQYPALENSWAAYSKEVHRVARETGVNRDPNYITGYPEWLKANAPDVFEKHAHIFAPPPDDILQIKGKGNAAPKEKYLPMVQDFVRSGNWGSVGDFKNTGLIAVDPSSDIANALQTSGKKVPQYVTQDELTKLLAWSRGEGNVPQGYARGGLVQDTDAIAAKLKATGMDDQKAFMQALRMADARQEAHMAKGGLLKALKGAAKTEEATKVAKPAKAAAEAPKPVAGPQAEALETARKNAVKMLGLPENNTAMDRAKALGFTDSYHGTNQDVPQIDMSMAGTQTGNPNAHLGFFSTPNTAEASRYSKDFGGPQGGNVMPLMVRRGNEYPISYKELNDISMGIFNAPGNTPKEKYVNASEWAKDKRKQLTAEGYDTAVFRKGTPVEEVIALKPEIVRSRFAAFDPARINESDLLGAADPALLAGVAVGSGLGLDAIRRLKKEEQKPEEQKKARGGLAKRV